MPKGDYTAFDKFIKAKMKDGILFIGMSNTELQETLKRLGIRRVATIGDDGRRYVNNAYPKKSQVDHVKEVIEKTPTQQRLDKSSLYEKDDYGYRAKTFVFFNDKTYRKGQFLPKRYLDE